MRAKLVDISLDILSRKQRVTFEFDGDFRQQYDDLKDKELEITVKPFRAKRSKNANAYCWELLGKLGEALNLPPKELYRRAIKEVGVYQDVELEPRAAKTMEHIWTERGIGWVTEKVDDTFGGVLIRFYYGSSVYNTKQMSRLIDYIVEDCREQGIETKTPQELSLLLDEWEENK